MNPCFVNTLASWDVASCICQTLVAGRQAEVLNKILADMFLGQPISEVKLKEVLGRGLHSSTFQLNLSRV